MSALPIIVTAYVLPGKPDPSAEAHFANSDRAAGYARELADSGYYCSVLLNGGSESHEMMLPSVKIDGSGTVSLTGNTDGVTVTEATNSDGSRCVVVQGTDFGSVDLR